MKARRGTVRLIVGLALPLMAAGAAGAEDGAKPLAALDDGRFSWKATGPLVSPDPKGADKTIAVKDPTIVRHDGRWRLFVTVRTASGKVGIEYSNFARWQDADRAERHALGLHDKYHGAPQVFFFRPHTKWYLIYQIADLEHMVEKTGDKTKGRFGPGYSTSGDLADPKSWSKPAWLFPDAPAGPKWLDFWVICDDAKAHLFYTSLDGKMWRSATPLDRFPGGWAKPEVAIQADIFEASHTYKLRGRNEYLTIVEAQGDGRRYYKAYLAPRLEGPWKPLADTIRAPFAGHANVKLDPPWTTNISHGELLRAGVDERLEADPARLRFLFQGASDPEYRASGGYGKIPWRLGLLEPAE